LLDLNEEEILAEVENSPLFEHLNNKKISAYTKKLIQSDRSTAKQSDIRNGEGENFQNENSRKNYIWEYFKEVYKKRPNDDENLSIEDFLGKEVLQNIIVQESKLSAAEKDLLERPFEITELDAALKDAKITTAGGIDGIGNNILKKFWQYMRIPLFRCAEESLAEAELPASFKTAGIKLIPKKGQSSDIGNWRPISLLNCSYKLISKCINNRLKKIVERVLSRAQKGFVSHRSIHEVMINLIERVSQAKNGNEPAAFLSVDFSKAFDSVSHKFLRECLKFFGFGDYFISMIDTCCLHRNAVILWDDGSISKKFELERGNSQGDGPSPCLFNLAIQILIFKIELTADLIPAPYTLDNMAYVPPLAFEPLQHECNKETNKSEVFADDYNASLYGTAENLNRAKTILSDFATLSGLCCNVAKTSVMLINVDARETEIISTIGFPIVDSLKTLGIIWIF